MKKIITLLAAVFALFLTGCNSNYYTSVSKAKVNSPQRDQVITTDILNFMRGYYSPANTLFYIDKSTSPQNQAFSQTLENKFRAAGFALTDNNQTQSYYIPFAWKIDNISSEIVRATFVVDNATITRLYKGTDPVSPFTVRGLAKNPPYRSYAFLRSAKGSSLSRANKNGGLLARIVASSLNVREKPTTHSKVLRKYKKGTYLRLSKKVKNKYSEYWYKLQNYSGYVSANHVREVR